MARNCPGSGTGPPSYTVHSSPPTDQSVQQGAPSPVNDATGPAICSSKGPTCEPSSTSLLVSSAAMICPVSASTPIWSFLQDRRVLVACFGTSHSPGPQSLSPVLSTSRCSGSLPGRGRDTGNVSPRPGQAQPKA